MKVPGWPIKARGDPQAGYAVADDLPSFLFTALHFCAGDAPSSSQDGGPACTVCWQAIKMLHIFRVENFNMTKIPHVPAVCS